MSDAFDLILRGGTVVNHDGTGLRDIAIKDGRFTGLGDLKGAKAVAEIDARGLTILPGVIDTQVHFREPGLEHKEDLETGSQAAVMGGVTAVFEMPNTRPATTTAELLADKVKRASGRMHCDFAFFVGATRDNIDEIPMLERLPGSAGIKVFMGSSTGDLLVADEESLSRIIGRLSRRASFHAEDEARLKARAGERVPGRPESHPVWRDEETAFLATERLVRLAEQHRRRVHVLHISSAREIEFLSRHKAWASVEATPHHLTLAAPECYRRLGTYAQMNPPVRDEANQRGIWQGIADGTVDILGSDHAPHTREEKDHTYPDSHSGMTGVQTLLPVMLDHVANGRLSLHRLVDLTSAGPARLFGIRAKGRIAMGYDADLSVVDLKRPFTITNGWIRSRCGWTPYDGLKVASSVVGTFVRGRKVMWEGELIERAQGRAVGFHEAGT